jgi:hypothetical protein
MTLSGFYEGSVIFGNRFKDANLNALRVLDNIKPDDVVEADEFVRSNLGLILHNDSSYYSKLYSIKEPVKRALRLAGHPYFYQVDDGKFISQARMSTGENLLITILHSLNLRRYNKLKFDDGRPFIVFLDEIELALHASSLRRLLLFLRQISDDHVHLTVAAGGQQPLEALSTVLGPGQGFIRVHPAVEPAGMPLDHVAVVADLRGKRMQHGVLPG